MENRPHDLHRTHHPQGLVFISRQVIEFHENIQTDQEFAQARQPADPAVRQPDRRRAGDQAQREKSAGDLPQPVRQWIHLPGGRRALRPADHTAVRHAHDLQRPVGGGGAAGRILFYRPGRADAVRRGGGQLDRRQVLHGAVVHPAAALIAAAFFGALWGLLPALIREYTGANEIIVTLLLNPIAGVLAGFFPMGDVLPSARLLPLVASTKFSAGFILCLACAALVYFLLWKTGKGLEIRNAAQAPRFAQYGGIRPHLPVLCAMLISGALAGLAGAVEVLGVHYKFVSTFSAVTDFDGLIVAFARRPAPGGRGPDVHPAGRPALRRADRPAD